MRTDPELFSHGIKSYETVISCFGTSGIPPTPPQARCGPANLPTPPTPPGATQPSTTCLSRAIEANHFLYDGQYLVLEFEVLISSSIFLASGNFQFCIVELIHNKQVGITATTAPNWLFVMSGIGNSRGLGGGVAGMSWNILDDLDHQANSVCGW